MIKIVEDITRETIKNSEEEVGGVMTTVKSYHFKRGCVSGHLAAIIPQEDYRTIIGDEEWEYQEPEELDEYATVAVTASGLYSSNSSGT